MNSISGMCLHLRDVASVVIELGLEVEALEEPLYASSPLGIRVRIGMICRGCELEISGILLIVDLRVMDMSKFDIILGMDWLTAYRVVIDLREEILKEFHYSRFDVHPGGTKMYKDLRCLYYWSGMKRHVGDLVQRCLTCQQVMAEHQRPAGLLQPLEVAEWKWEHVTMNFVTHLPRTPQRHDAVWVIVERLMKLAHFLAVLMTFTLERFCRL